MVKTSQVKKAKTVAKELKQSSTKGVHKVYTKPRFYRPRTQKTVSVKKTLGNLRSEIRRTDKNYSRPDYRATLVTVLNSDKNVQKMEKENTLVFQVAEWANKSQIKEAFFKLYNTKARSVNTMFSCKGKKKAYIRLANDKEALNLASKIGVL